MNFNNFCTKVVIYAKSFVLEQNLLKKVLDVAFKHEYLDFNKIREQIEGETTIEW